MIEWKKLRPNRSAFQHLSRSKCLSKSGSMELGGCDTFYYYILLELFSPDSYEKLTLDY